MKRNRRAKVIATLGPATARESEIERLFEAGADVFRLNFSHGEHSTHRSFIRSIRAVERRHHKSIAILADMQGPKLRVGVMEAGGALLKPDQPFRLELNERVGNERCASLPHPEVFGPLQPEMKILLDDGRIRLEVTEVGKDFAETVVLTGGRLTDRKGVNLPDVILSLAALTEKDVTDLEFALSEGADWIALSFVQRPEDVARAREIIGDRAAIMSKLEKPAAIDRLDEVIALSDAIMVARGDLGVELEPEDVPAIQKRVVRLCRQAGKPVVVATQMLESMVHSPMATRAEASDVANAIYDGADAVMLSAETAAGQYPDAAVAVMDRIIARVERDDSYRAIMDALYLTHEHTTADAITAAARQVSETIGAAAIVTFTTSGSTTLRAARERPSVPILSLTEHVRTARRLAIVWGAHTVVTADVMNFSDMVEKSSRLALLEGLVREGDRLVVTAGVPFGTPGTTNILRIVRARGPR